MKKLLLSLIGLALSSIAFGNPGDVTTINTISPQNYPNSFQYIVRSTDVFVSTLTFTKNLGSADVNLQHAMNTIDQLSSSAGTISTITAGTGITVTNSTGPIVTISATGTGSGNISTMTAGPGITLTNSTGPVTIIQVTSTTVSAGSYTNTNLTVNAQGQITAASNGSAGSSGSISTITAGVGISVVNSTGPNVTISATGAGGSGSISTITAGANIVVTNSTGPNVTVALSSNVSIATITVTNYGSFTNVSTMTFSLGTDLNLGYLTPSTYLGVDANGNVISTTTPTGSGGSIGTITAGSNIIVTNSTGPNVTVSLSSNVTVSTLTVTSYGAFTNVSSMTFSAGTDLILNYLTPNSYLAVDGNGNVISTTTPTGGGGGGGSGALNTQLNGSGVVTTSTLNVLSPLTMTNIGGVGTLGANVINNQSSNQSGSVFNVSSGTDQGTLYVSTLALIGSTTYGQYAIDETGTGINQQMNFTLAGTNMAYFDNGGGLNLIGTGNALSFRDRTLPVYTTVDFTNNKTWQIYSVGTSGGNFGPMFDMGLDNGQATIGSVAYGYDGNTAGAQLLILPYTSSTIGQIIKGQSGQSADLLDLETNSGLVLGSFNSSGFLTNAQISTQYITDYANAVGYWAMAQISGTSIQAVNRVATMTVVGVQGASGQSADLQDWKNSSNSVLASVSSVGSITTPNLTDSALTSGQCVQAGSGGLLETTGSPCGSGGGGSGGTTNWQSNGSFIVNSASANFVSPLTLTSVGGVATIGDNSIFNQTTRQAGAALYVDSATAGIGTILQQNDETGNGPISINLFTTTENEPNQFIHDAVIHAIIPNPSGNDPELGGGFVISAGTMPFNQNDINYRQPYMALSPSNTPSTNPGFISFFNGSTTPEVELTSTTVQATKKILVSPTGAQGEIDLGASSGGTYVGLKSSATIATSTVWTLPNADGSSGQVMATDGNKNLYFTTISGGSGSGIVSPGTFTWINNFGMSVSTLVATSSITLTNGNLILPSATASPPGAGLSLQFSDGGGFWENTLDSNSLNYSYDGTITNRLFRFGGSNANFYKPLYLDVGTLSMSGGYTPTISLQSDYTSNSSSYTVLSLNHGISNGANAYMALKDSGPNPAGSSVGQYFVIGTNQSARQNQSTVAPGTDLLTIDVSTQSTNGNTQINGVLTVVSASTQPSTLTTGLIVSGGAAILQGMNSSTLSSAGNYGERFSSSVLTATNIPTTTQWGDLASINLTTGAWIVTLQECEQSAGATITSGGFIAISTTSGNNSGGLNYPDNEIELPLAATTDGCGTISGYQLNLASNTTIYAKMQDAYSLGQPTMKGRISANRIY